MKKLMLVILIGMHGTVAKADWLVNMVRRVYVWERMRFDIQPRNQLVKSDSGETLCLDQCGNPMILGKKTIMHQDGRIFVWSQKSEQDHVVNCFVPQEYAKLKERLQDISERAYQDWTSAIYSKSHM